LTCWTALGCWGCLVFCFTLLSTSWDSWNWWKPDTLSKTVTFSGGKLVQLLLTCWTAFGFWGCLVVLLHTTLYFLGLLELVEARHTVKDCHLFWWETGAVTSDLLDCLWILGMLGCSASHYSLLLGTPGTGGSQTHCQILPPFLVGNWCICY